MFTLSQLEQGQFHPQQYLQRVPETLDNFLIEITFQSNVEQFINTGRYIFI
jgi:hypothetical protein